MNIKTAPAAMIQLAVFEDMNLILKLADRKNRWRRTTGNLFHSYMPNIPGYSLKLQMTKVTSVAEA